MYYLDLTGDYFDADTLKGLIKEASEFYADRTYEPDFTIVDLHEDDKSIADERFDVFLSELEAAIEDAINEYEPEEEGCEYESLTGHEMGVCQGRV